MTGSDYKPANTAASGSAQKENKKPAAATAAAAAATSAGSDELLVKITQQGEKVRELKANKSTPKVSTSVM